MAKMTQSFEHWCFKYHKDIFVPLLFGHVEMLTAEMEKEYYAWCLTDEGKQYLKGGSKYNPEHKGNMAFDKAVNKDNGT